MAEDYQTSLRFSLKEAVWFKRGQEVADLLSIELNPQIGIEEKEEYVQVKGTLELYGEYNKEEEEETFSLRDFSQTATVEEVIEREDGIYVFTHNFPIDITIPKKRVKELEDIYILVDSFDYELPESNTLQITADISITGLYEGEQEEEREEQEKQKEQEEQLEEADNEEFLEGSGELLNEESQNESSEEKESTPILPYQSMIESIFKEFSFEARKAPVEEVELEQGQEEYGEHSEEDYEEQEQEEYELQNQRGYEEQEQEKYEAQEQEEYELHEQVESAEQSQEEYKEKEQKEYELQNQRGDEEHGVEEQEKHESPEQREEHPHIEFFSQQAEEEQQELEQEEEHVEEELKAEVTVSRSENELYLTKLFGNKEENFKKVRIYIVQNGDTLESIAEKYELQVQQIARRNHLEEFYLTEGQILYLPVKKSQ